MLLLLILLLISNVVVFNHALAPPPPYSSSIFSVRSRSPLITTAQSPLQNYKQHHPSPSHLDDRRVLMVRGGDSDIDDTTDDEEDGGEESEEYDNIQSDDDEYADESSDDENSITSGNKINEPSQQDIERYQLSSQLSSQSRNFGIATALWGSLFFDSILNTAKRELLFPTMTQSTTTTAASALATSSSLRATIVPTTLLASGFGLASIISFLLWRDLETRSDMLSSEDGKSSSKGDDFLSLSTLSISTSDNADDNDKEETEKFESQTRTTLYAHLSIFGILSLAAHTGYYFSKDAPFLGMSAAIINIHNALAYVSALLKEKQLDGGLVGGLLQLLVMWPMSLFQSKKDDADEDGSGKKLELSSFIFRLGSIVACMQCIPIGKYLYTNVRLLMPPMAAVQQDMLQNFSRVICLKIASVARLSLVAGASHTLFKASKSEVYRHHPFFTVLSGVFGVGCLSVAGAILFDTLINTSSLTVLSSVAVRNGLTIMLFGLFATWHSVKGIMSSLPQRTGVEA